VGPPTVPQGTSRLRIAVMASHTKSELRWAAEVLAEAIAGAEPMRKPVVPRRDSRVYDGVAEAA
jgi:hypothetical protein